MASYKYIQAEELVALLDNPQESNKVAVIDCRDDDRNEGFIVGSIHAPTFLYNDAKYLALAKQLAEEGKLYAVFHCALSQIRGPRGAGRFAAAQREAGLQLPNVFVLKGGWEEFYMIYGRTRQDLIYV